MVRYSGEQIQARLTSRPQCGKLMLQVEVYEDLDFIFTPYPEQVNFSHGSNFPALILINTKFYRIQNSFIGSITIIYTLDTYG